MKITLRVLLSIGVGAIALGIYWQYTSTPTVSPLTERTSQQVPNKALPTAASAKGGTGVQPKTEKSQQQERWDKIAASASNQAPADIAVDEEFSSMMDQRIALFEYASRVQESKEEEKPKHLFAYFKALPRDFKTFFQVTHSTYSGDVITVYSVDDLACTCDDSNPWGTFYPGKVLVPEKPEETASKFTISRPWKEVLEARLAKLAHYEFLIKDYKENGMLPIELGDFFYAFKVLKEVIPEEAYYRKLLAVSVGAFWNMNDAIVSFQGELWILVHNNLPLFVKILDEYSDDEIASIFYFMDAGIHPEDKCIKPSSCPYKALAELSPKVAHNFERANYQFKLRKPSPSCELHNY